MTSTIQDIVDAVIWDLMNGRDDLIPRAANFALKAYEYVCGRVPFPELQALTAELPMTAGTADYSIANLDPPLAGIVSIRATITNNIHRRLRRSHGRVYDHLGFIKNGPPSTYARWSDTLTFNPPPDSSAYTYRIRYWNFPSGIPHRGADLDAKLSYSLITPTDWDILLVYETMYHLLHSIEEYERAQMLIAPPVMQRMAEARKVPSREIGVLNRLWNDLLLRIDEREHVDEDFSVSPVMRAYTYTGGR